MRKQQLISAITFTIKRRYLILKNVVFQIDSIIIHLLMLLRNIKTIIHPSRQQYNLILIVWDSMTFLKFYTAWKVSKYGVFSGPYFPVFGMNTEIYGVDLRIQSEYRKIRARKNFVFGHFSRCHKYTESY